MPPRRLRRDHAGDFAAAGDELLGHLRDLCELRPDERVLDVRCGMGHAARALAGYLNGDGSYAGFDADAVAIGWCQSRYPERFRFTVVDVYDAGRHPTGTERADAFAFPYADDEFDVAVLDAVLSRLLEAEAAHHLRETARVLRPGGRALATLYVLDEDSRAAMREGRAAMTFLQPDAHVAVRRDDAPEEAIAYDEGWLREQAALAGLTVRDGVHRGRWRGGPADGARAFGDIMVLCA